MNVQVPVTCAHCGAEVRLINSGGGGSEATGVIECTNPECRRQFYLSVIMRLLAVPKDEKLDRRKATASSA